MWDILGGDHPRRGGRIDAASGRSRNVALPHQHRQCGEPADGSHRSWSRNGTQVVRPSEKTSRERTGRLCNAGLWRRTRKSMLVTQVEAAGQRRFGR